MTRYQITTHAIGAVVCAFGFIHPLAAQTPRASKPTGWSGTITVRTNDRTVSGEFNCTLSTEEKGSSFIEIKLNNVPTSGGAIVKAKGQMHSERTTKAKSEPEHCGFCVAPSRSNASGSFDVSIDLEALTRPAADGSYTLWMRNESNVEAVSEGKTVTAEGCTRVTTTHEVPLLGLAFMGIEEAPKGHLIGNDSTHLTGSVTQTSEAYGKTVTTTWDLTLGAPAATVALNGCTDIVVGQSTTITAKADVSGGTYDFTVDPPDIASLAPLGASASLTGGVPGEGTLTVEYTSPDGKKAKATKPVSCVQLQSINGGAPVRMGLFDAAGKPLNSIRTVAVLAQPAGAASRLRFEPANPALIGLAGGSSDLQIQALKEGQTVVRALTACGKPAGPSLTVDIVRCDTDVIAELNRKRDLIKGRNANNRKQQTDLTSDDEFDRAAREVADHTKEMAIKTAEMLAATMGAGNLASEAASKAGEAYDIYSLANDVADGKLTGAALSATIMALKSGALKTLAGTAKTAYEASAAAQQLGQDLGTLSGTADRLKELEDQAKATEQELADVEGRLKNVCKVGATPPGQPPTGPQPPPKPSDPSGKTQEPRGKEPAPKDATDRTQKPTEDAAKDKTSPPEKTGTDKKQPPEKPEQKQPKTGGGGGGESKAMGVCGCGGSSGFIGGNSASLSSTATTLKKSQGCLGKLEATAISFHKAAATGFDGTTDEIEAAKLLAPADGAKKIDAIKPGIVSMFTTIAELGRSAKGVQSMLSGCGTTLQAAPALIRKSASQ